VTHDLQIVAVSDVNPADLDALVAVLAKVQSSGGASLFGNPQRQLVR
jgi:hypothetical protein